MILDTSAIVCILLREPGYEAVLQKLLTAPRVAIGVPTLTECGIVLSARAGSDARGLLSRFVSEASIALIPFGDIHYAAAIGAWLHFGRGRHKAALNFGDCLSYAVAKVAEEPLLCTGKDFEKTDLDLA